MNNQFDDPKDLAGAWQWFITTRKWIVRTAFAFLITVCFFTCNTANGQERAVLVSSSKISLSTKFYLCVETKDGKRYSFKYDSHCWNCKVINIPTYWDVLVKRRKTFIKPVL